MKNGDRKVRCAAFFLGASSLAIGAAYAQTEAPRDEIYVTAQKRSQRLQDVPIQVDAVSAEELENKQIRQTSELARIVPNFTIERTDTYTNSVIVLRGIAQASRADAPVAVIVDGVPQDDSKQLNKRLFDVEQIEVLRGPQGSIYGRNAEAGAIVIRTKAPTDEFSAFADLSYGNGDTFNATASLSGPIVPGKVRFRLAGNFYTSNGVIENSFTGEGADKVNHDISLRGNLEFLLSDQTTLRLIGNYSDFDAAGVIFAPVFSGDANDFVNPQSNFPNRGSGDSKNFTVHLEHEFPFATFSSISGYTRLDQVQITDLDFTPALGVGNNQPYSREITSQEFRLVSPGDSRLRWLVAADVLHSKHYLATRVFADMGDPESDPFTFLDTRPEKSRRTNYGVSAQIDYDVLDDLTLTVGARYDQDERKTLDYATGTYLEETFDKFQPRVSLVYRFDDDRQVYATYAVGFRSGAFNGADFPIAQPESLTNYELGFKSQWADRRVTLNGAVFYNDVKDYQFSYIDFVARANVTSNIDKVSIIGAELELSANPVDPLTVFTNVGLAKTEIEDFSIFPALEGNHTPRSADWSIAAGFDYTQDISTDLDAFLRGDIQYMSERYWFHDNLDVQDPRSFGNLSAGIETDVWSLSVWAKNVYDTQAYDTYFPLQATGLPYDVAFPTRPRTYGVRLTLRH